VNCPSAPDHKGSVATNYGIRAMPSSYLIDRRGRIIKVHRGFRQNAVKEREAQIKSLLKRR
ncbi:MAG: TlpA family protein disulfide reductase, partial [Gammaproteobacteria bacterium]|nr:TlpA family protein disulfide reductase [Gammaproteobacteria bacterium]